MKRGICILCIVLNWVVQLFVFYIYIIYNHTEHTEDMCLSIWFKL